MSKQIKERDKKFLIQYFNDDISKLESLISLNLDRWKME